MARIAIVDDHPFFRMGLEAALGEAGHQVVLSTGDSLTAEGQLAASDAQVVLLDQRMAPKTGADILSAIRLAGDTRPVVVLTNELGDRALLEVMRALSKQMHRHLPDRLASSAAGSRSTF